MSKKIYSYRTNKLYESESFEGPFYIKEDFNCNGKSGCRYIEDETDAPAVFDDYIAAYDAATSLADEKSDELRGNVREKRDAVEVVDTNNDECLYTYTIVDSIDGSCDDTEYELEVEDDAVEESVASRFGKYRKLYESDEEEKEEDDDDEEEKEEDDDEEEKEEGGDEGDGDELKAIKLTVAKDDVDKCKEELIDAGIEEKDIEVVEGEIVEGEDDDEDVVIRVDVNSVMPLKDYLDGKGINLEDEIGAEIISDDSDEDKEGEGEGDEEDSEKKDDEKEGDLDFDSMDFFADEK